MFANLGFLCLKLVNHRIVFFQVGHSLGPRGTVVKAESIEVFVKPCPALVKGQGAFGELILNCFANVLLDRR
jgi:hypothetical protein